MMFSRAAFDSLESEGVTRAWNGLGGSHTFVTYPPLDALRPLPSAAVVPHLTGISELNLYVHLPFCEMSCPFCPYETHVISDQDRGVERYLRALAGEMDLVGPRLRNARVRSLYIGGGTATVLSETQLETLLDQLRDHFAMGAESLICIETSPNALIRNRGKIELLKRLGVKRVSVGVQTLSETALRSEGRTHAPGETLQMLESLIREAEVVNVDLMQDMPGQTDDDLANDVDQIAKLQPAQVTWYVERLRKWQGQFPDSYRSIERRLWIHDRMKQISYQPRPGGRFVRAGCNDDAFKKVRCGLDSHLVGLGASAYGHLPGFFYRNIVDTASYVNAVLEGEMPIATGLQLRKVDILAAALASGIRWGVALKKPEPDTEAYLCEAKRKLDLLVRHRLVDFDSEKETYQITLDGPGWAYEEEICSLFVPQDVVDQIRANNLPWWA